MKKKYWLALIFVLTYPSLFAQNSGSSHVAVVQFEEKGNIGMKDAGKIIAEWMNSAIIKTGKYQVIERVLLKNVLDEQELSSSDLIDPRKAVKLGNLYGAQALISGSIIEWQKTYSLSARMIDVSTGKVISSAEYRTKDIQTFPAMMDKIAQVLAGQLPQEALDKLSATAYNGDSQNSRFNVLQILKARERNGETEFVLGGGLDRGIHVGDLYRIYVPRLEKSAITDEPTVTGNDEVALLEISYLEAHLCLAKVVGISGDPKVIAARGFAVPSSSLMGLSFGIWGRTLPDSGYGMGLSLDMLYSKSIYSTCMGYATETWYPLWFDFVYKYHLIGYHQSAFKLSLGGDIGIGGGSAYRYKETYSNEIKEDKLTFRVTFAPFIDLSLFGFFVQGGVTFYYDPGFRDYLDKNYGISPFIKAGIIF